MAKKIVRVIIIFVWIILIMLNANEARVKATEKNYAYFTIEKFVLGQGYVLEPTKIEIMDNESVAAVLMRLANREGISLMSRFTDYGLYLHGMADADSGKYDIPSVIYRHFYNDIKEYLVDGNPVKEESDSALEEFDFTPYSGWLYFVNDEWQFYGISSRYLSPNEVVRLKFSIAPGDSGWGMSGSEQISFPDESQLIRTMAELKEKIKGQPDDNLSKIYKDALSIMSDLDASEMNVDRLTAYMADIEQAVLNNDREKISEIKTNVDALLKVVKISDASQKIALIPESLTEETMFIVRNARKAYKALDEESRSGISESSYNKLIKGEEQLSQLEEQIRKQKLQDDAQKVRDKIRAIGSVTLDKKDMIVEARNAYNALESEAKLLIDSATLNILVDAEIKIAALIKEEADNTAASQVTAKINAIGTVTLAKESAVSAARKAYDALNADAKKLVASSVLAKLTTAEAKITLLKKEAALKKKYTPAKVVLKTPKPGRKKVKLTWKKISKATGYQIYMSTKKSSGYKKIATIKKAKTVTYTRKKLKSKKDYYFKIRAYRKVGKKTYYGAWSKVRKAKAK